MARVAQSETWPATVAQQVFVVGSAIAGLIAGTVLAGRLANVSEVPKKDVMATTIISVIFTVGSGVILAKHVEGVV